MRFLTDPRAVRGRLVSAGSTGEEVYAGSYLRKREIVLDRALRSKPGELSRIFVHELFHFIWLRSSNALRRSYERLAEEELHCHARGELGWSAESRKARLAPNDIRRRTRRWREYVCESFCDSAAWLYSGLRRHREFTRARRFRDRRRRWFRCHLSRTPVSI